MKTSAKFRYGLIVFAILASSLLLRLILVTHGGQYYWPDEYRYEASRTAAHYLWAGDIYSSLKSLHSAAHFLFKVIGVVPASVQLLIAPSPKIPALFFSLFSVANLWLGWSITRRIGGGDRAGLFAVSLLAMCSTLLYYSRHLLPYDVAMTFGLLGVFVGLHQPSRAVDSILCGLFSACCFLTYNGYWILAGFAILTHALNAPCTVASTLRRISISGLCLAAPLVFLLVTSRAVGGNLLLQFLVFSRTVKQGEYSEGWSLPFSFLWHSEQLLTLLWAAALLWGLGAIAARSRTRAVIFAVSGIMFVYGTVVIFSSFLEKFVVYGRIARQLVPFFCILAALFLDRLWACGSKGKPVVAITLLLALCQSLWNFRQPITQMYPPEFLQAASKCMVSGDEEDYAVLFAGHIYPEPLSSSDFGTIILQRRHPLQFLPYQYEGFTKEQRSKLRSTDISMRLILKER